MIDIFSIFVVVQTQETKCYTFFDANFCCYHHCGSPDSWYYHYSFNTYSWCYHDCFNTDILLGIIIVLELELVYMINLKLPSNRWREEYRMPNSSQFLSLAVEIEQGVCGLFCSSSGNNDGLATRVTEIYSSHIIFVYWLETLLEFRCHSNARN